jgi:AraC-like DNA-binding protein/mannose-6-phosphate isomerase-like protein (cupin superfamily)
MPDRVDRLAEAAARADRTSRITPTGPVRYGWPPANLSHMAVFVWAQELQPDFPLHVLEYTVRGDSDPMHWHDHFEIALVLEGGGTFMFGRRMMPAEPGDVFFIDNSQPHVAMAGDGGPMRLLLVLFRPELIASSSSGGLETGYLAPFRVDDRVASPRIPGSTALAAEVGEVLCRLQRIWAGHDPAERYLADATLRLALALVNRDPRVGRREGAARVAADRREQIRPVLAYVDGHCRESITLEDVAPLVHVSPSRVRHLFKDVTGVNFKAYVTQVRIAEAKRLLLTTDCSVAEIARRVSYTNLHQFYKVFHRACAMSPGEYRRYYTPSGADVVADAVAAGSG